MKELNKNHIVIGHVCHGSAQALSAAIIKAHDTNIVVVDDVRAKESKVFQPQAIPFVLTEQYIKLPEIRTGQEQRRAKRKNNRTDKFGNKRK